MTGITSNTTQSGEEFDVFRAARECLEQNPDLQHALELFHVAESQYRESLQALESVRIYSSQSTVSE